VNISLIKIDMKLNYADWNATNSLAVSQKGKPAVYINNRLDFEGSHCFIWQTVMDSLKQKMNGDEFYNSIPDLICGGLFFFDTMGEAREFFDIFTQNVVYDSPIYAQLYNAKGMRLMDNT